MKREDSDELITVAHGVRTRGLKGEIVAELLTDFPERFENISEIYAVGKQEIKTLELEDHWFQNGRVILKFAGIDDIENAKSLVGFDFALPESDRVQLSDDEYYDWELEGCDVVTKDGFEVGTVVSVLRTGGVALLAVTAEDKREILVPMAQAIVTGIDLPAKKITIDPPEGLLDL